MDHKAMLLKLLGQKSDATDDQIQKAHDEHMASIEASAESEKAAKATAKNAQEAQAAAEAAKEKAEKAQGEADKKAVASNAEAAQAKKDAEKFRAAAINGQRVMAINSGRLTAAEWTEFEKKFAVDFDAAETELKGRKTALNTKSLDLHPMGLTEDLTTPLGRTMAFNAFLDPLMLAKENGGPGLSFDAAMNKMKSDDKGRAILAAMNPAEAAS